MVNSAQPVAGPALIGIVVLTLRALITERRAKLRYLIDPNLLNAEIGCGYILTI